MNSGAIETGISSSRVGHFFLVFGAFKINQKFIQTYLQNEIIASNFL